MVAYEHYFGIDVGKFNFVVARYGTKSVTEYDNTTTGINKFIHDTPMLSHALCVVETTGGHELELLYSLSAENIKAHRADAKQVKNFIRSLGGKAKTDALDAKALAQYAYERSARPEAFQPNTTEDLELFKLVQRRNDLNKILVAEKNILQSPNNCKTVVQSCEQVLACIEDQLTVITEKIQTITTANDEFAHKQKILTTIPGIGKILSFELLILLPELGNIDRRQLASLSGVAPIANDSGIARGYRRTGQGRQGVKKALFVAALAASHSNSAFKDYYQKLLTKGKKKMVALTALMRKIIVVANAKLKEAFKQPGDVAMILQESSCD